MAERPFIFVGKKTELILPVTPESYQLDTGINIEIVNIHELGDVTLAGYGTLATIKIDCLLPYNSYHFSNASDPWPYIEQLEEWSHGQEVVRFIVGGTNVNLPVRIQNVAYGERDGTNDIYASITLREYRDLEAVQISTTPAPNKQREELDKTGSEDYLIQKGDTLSALCRKFYGSGSADFYNRLAKYNGIKNPHLIYTGNTLKIPRPLP